MDQDQSAASISVRSVTKRFGEVAAVDGVSLDILRGEFFSLLGPSGCGKTTLLRMIAGLEMPTGGQILINGREVTHLPPYSRPVNLVFQHYALFPHLTAAKNVAFGLRYKGGERRQEGAKVAQALDLVRLAGLQSRYPHELSGGQRQRVALARALVLEPQVLLLDEPLGALDQKLRKEMQVELKNLQRTLGITFVFVTHDQEEALTMSDRVAVMNLGKVEQTGASAEVFERPVTEFVARFMGATNVLPADVRDATGEPIALRGGDACVHFVRPEKLRLRASPAPKGDRFSSLAVKVEQRIYQGTLTVWHVRAEGGLPLTVCEQNSEPVDGLEAAGDANAFVWLDPAHLVCVPRDTGRGANDGK
jgi:ABC-type Fe3+/spermidine/putrescine transport system ATPase subunit